jgi:hypothetical protein
MSDLRTLIAAARADAPSTAARANVWAGVSTVVGEAAGLATGAGGGAGAGSAGGAAKMLILGTLLGGSVTVGIGGAMLLVGHAPAPRPMVSAAAPAPAEMISSSIPVLMHPSVLNREAVEEAPLKAGRVSAGAVRHPPAVRAAGLDMGKKGAAGRGSLSPAVAGTESDTLALEASALAEARGALARHDALSALQIVRGLRALPGRQLVPEELAVEAQALRGLGLDDDANAVETHLRARFPDSVLGR